MIGQNHKKSLRIFVRSGEKWDWDVFRGTNPSRWSGLGIKCISLYLSLWKERYPKNHFRGKKKPRFPLPPKSNPQLLPDGHNLFRIQQSFRTVQPGVIHLHQFSALPWDSSAIPILNRFCGESFIVLRLYEHRKKRTASMLHCRSVNRTTEEWHSHSSVLIKVLEGSKGTSFKKFPWQSSRRSLEPVTLP